MTLLLLTVPSPICKLVAGLAAFIPTLPVSNIVKTSSVLSNTFNKSAVPVPLMYATGLELLSETIDKSPRLL